MHRRGLRFRVDVKLGDGRSAPRPDVVFPRQRVAVFIDGCFWHGCPSHGVRPQTNAAYWSAKIRRNQERDRSNTDVLRAAGWDVVRVWEHEPVEAAVDRIATTVAARR